MSELRGSRIAGLPTPTTLNEGDQVVRSGTSMAGLQTQPTNQGVNQLVFDGVPSGSINAGSPQGTFVAITGLSGTFVAPYAGLYTFLLSVTGFQVVSVPDTARWRLNITGATTTIVGDSPQWATTRNEISRRGQTALVGSAQLAAGSHNIALEFSAGTAANFNIDATGAAGATLWVSNPGGTATTHYDLAQNALHTTTVTKSDATMATIETGVTSGVITAPAAGTFEVQVEHAFDMDTNDAHAQVSYQLLVNSVVVAGDPATTITPGWNTWAHRPPSPGYLVHPFSASAPVTLLAGANTWELKWRVPVITGGSVRVISTDNRMYCRVIVRGGAALQISPPVIEEDALTGDFTSDGTTNWQDTGLEVTVQGDGVRQFEVLSSVMAFAASTRGLAFRVDIDGTPYDDSIVGIEVNSALLNNAKLVWWTPVLGAGARVIKIQARIDSAVVFTLDHTTTAFGVHPPYLKARPIN